MNITQQELKELLHYDPETGVFTWKKREGNSRGDKVFNSKYVGNTAGYLRVDKCRADGSLKYLQIKTAGKVYSAHRLAWLYMTGDIPPEAVDHIDGNGLNNKWTNLRDGTATVNARNQAMSRNNTSGIAGVSWHARLGKWQAQVWGDSKQHYLGLHETIEEAEAAVVAKRKELGGFTDRHGQAS